MVYVYVTLFLALIALAFLHLCQIFYEKYFFRSITCRIRDYLKDFIPGAVWKQEKNSEDPELFLNANINNNPFELHFVPGTLKRDVISPHTLSVSVFSNLEYRFLVKRKSLKPWRLLARWVATLFREEDYSLIESGNFRFDFLYECYCSEVRHFEGLLRSREFRDCISSCFVRGVEIVACKNGRVAANFSFMGFSQRPTYSSVERVASQLANLKAVFNGVGSMDTIESNLGAVVNK